MFVGILSSLISGLGNDISNIKINYADKTGVERRSRVIKWLLEIIGPFRFRITLGVLLTLSVTGVVLIPPYLLKVLINDVLLVKESKNLWVFQAIIIALTEVYASSVVLSIGQNYLLNYLGQRLSNEIRVSIYDFIFNQSLKFLDRFQ